jgi:hypothetical protein
MTKTLYLLLSTLLICSLSFSQSNKKNKDNYKFFDENYNPISQIDYEKKRKEYRLLSIQGDSINHRILSTRGIEGTLKNRRQFDSILSLATNKKIDSTKPLIIIYYPGKDPCNSSGSATRKTKRIWFNLMEFGINDRKESNIIYVYKTRRGLIDGRREWIKDPERTIERLFFKRHYPCSSFVIISENNKYKSHFGEFSKEYLWRSFELLIFS